MEPRQERYSVEFNPEGNVLVEPQQSLLEAALLAGIPLFHLCGGQARCSTCRVLVLQGGEWLTERTDKEQRLKEQMAFPADVRLACQTKVRGNSAKVARIIRDESDIGLYVGAAAGESSQQIGTEKELVLFFLDIRNFTAFVERHLAFDVIHIIRKLFTMVHSFITSNGGRIVETAGDSVYAVFSWEQPLSEGVSGAVRSGFAILEELQQLNQTYFQSYFSHTFQVGIGIHLGVVIGGNIRLGKEDHLVVMGHPVNIAARLQNATKELNNTYLISDAVYQHLRHPLPDHLTTWVHLKGVSEAVQVHLLGSPYA